MSVAIVAYGAVSALGEGRAAVSAGDEGAPARLAITRDPELDAAGLSRPFVARVAPGSAPPAFEDDRAAALLERALRDCMRELDAALPGWRSRRVGLAVGTSSGGMRSAEKLFAAVARDEAIDAPLAERALYSGPLLEVARGAGLAFAPASLVLSACASSTVAIGLGMRWLEAGACDVVLAGGFDAVSVFVAAGFEVLHATTASLPPRPFRVGRDGMALGEGAAIVALAREADVSHALGFVAGFGAAADAVHLTAPDRNGGGLARAATAAMADAGVSAIDLVSAHATATPYNDPSEARAIERALGDGAHSAVVHPFKAQIGHTLGAAGALEALACLDAMSRGVLPAAAGDGALDPASAVRLLETTRAGAPQVALKLSSAFGGANAALVLTREPPRSPRARASHDAFVSPAVHVEALPSLAELADLVGHPQERLARADALVLHALAALAALARLAHPDGSLAGAGIVVGSALATLETNARFEARIRERGARMAEPRRFPYTSPNAVAGECGVVFGLTGPAFTVGAGLHAGLEALAAATTLVRAGDAERMVVVVVEQIEEVARRTAAAASFPELASGAVALLVSRSRAGAVARVGVIDLPLPAHAGDARCTSLAPLLPLVGASGRLAPGPWVLTAGSAASISCESLAELT